MKRFLLLVTILIAFSLPATAQDTPAKATTDDTPATGDDQATDDGQADMIQLTFPANMEVKVLIDYVSQRLGMNVRYDESKVKRHVTILSPTKVPKDSLLGFLRGILRMTNLALVDAEQDGWKEIIESKTLLPASKGLVTELKEIAGAEATAVYTLLLTVEHTTHTAVEQTIKPFLSKPGGHTFAIADRRMLFVTDYADVLRRIMPLVTLMDQPLPEPKLTFVTAKNWPAGELARQVETLLAQKGRLTSGQTAAKRKVMLTSEPRTNQVVVISAGDPVAEVLDLIRRLDVPVPAETRTYRLKYIAPSRVETLARQFAEAEDTRAYFKATVDAPSGLLIVRTSAAVHDHLAALVGELDQTDGPGDAGHVRFYKILNTTAGEILSTIKSLESDAGGLTAESMATLSEVPPNESRNNFTGPNRPPAALGDDLPKPPSYTEPEKAGETTSTPATGTASDAGPRTLTATTADAVVTADVNTNTLIVVAPPPVQRVYERLIKLLDKRRPQVMLEMIMVTVDTSDNFSLGVQISDAGGVGDDGQFLTFSSFGLGAVDLATGVPTLAPGLGLNALLLDPGSVNVILRALASTGRTEVISAPRILVNDNATGTLSSVAESPFTSINASDTVATTSFGGYASAGTDITVTPHISEGDHLMLDYSLSLSSFGEGGAAGVPPPRQTDSISSNVTVPDGYTVVVGGLTRKDIVETKTKIPLLGDIPGLGHLFSSMTENEANVTLYVFIRPVILRDDQFEDLKYLSDTDRQAAGLPDEFPRSEPVIIR